MSGALENENIYLLEVMVDQAHPEPKAKTNFVYFSGDTCVSFEFLDNGPYCICDEDFIPTKKQEERKCTGCGNVKNGRSCLFSLTPAQMSETKKDFDLLVEMYKKFDDNSKPLIIGKGKMSLIVLFNEVLKAVDKAGPPCTKNVKECFKVYDSNDEPSGDIALYVRMSCLGKVIITKFQMNVFDESVQYSAKDGLNHYKYNGKPKTKCDDCKLCCKYPCTCGGPVMESPRQTHPQTQPQPAQRQSTNSKKDRLSTEKANGKAKK